LGGSKAREAGPAGEDGTYQFFNLKRSRVANSSTSVNGKALDLGKRFGQLIWWTLPRSSVVWLDKMPDNTRRSERQNCSDKSYATHPITPSWVSLWQYRYTASAMGQQEENLSHGVAAIILLLMIL
jgi:hypothetical protein